MKLKLFTNWEHFKFLSLLKWVSITESTIIYSNELWKTEEDLRDPDNWNMERNGHGSQGRLQRRSLNKNKQLLRRKLNRESRYRKGISGNSVRAIKERPPKNTKFTLKISTWLAYTARGDMKYSPTDSKIRRGKEEKGRGRVWQERREGGAKPQDKGHCKKTKESRGPDTLASSIPLQYCVAMG